MLNVTLVELSAFENLMPLVSGYLQAYACRDEVIAGSCSFDRYVTSAMDADAADVLAALADRDSDVYALSCYIWNMGLVRRILPELRRARPHARIILGGPQVMNHAAEYVPPEAENMLVCNGEGEITFYRFLVEMLTPNPDFAAIPGVGFWRDGQLVTTQPAERIRDLDEIPSPYSDAIFPDNTYTSAILETNRGCPFHCSFCYWGAATNDKVNKLELQRTLDDVTWISENGFVALMIADANWGIAPRDIEVTKHIVACHERTGFPIIVAMAAAKNRPERMAEITQILVRGGLLTSQPISLQTLSPAALQMVERSNIRPDTFSRLQQSLRQRRISSYIELIWPLPGETLHSFREGIGTLCATGSDTIIAYPHLLLHNTPMYARQELLGLRCERVADPVAEADVVVQTNWVSRAEYEQGVWFAYATHCLYNLRGLYYLASHLTRTGSASHAEFLTAAADYFQSRLDNPVARFFAVSVKSLDNYSMFNNGLVAHLTLHQERAAFSDLLASFARSQPWWSDPAARAAFELDLVSRPYIYHEPYTAPDFTFTEIGVEETGHGVLAVDLPSDTAAMVAELDMPDVSGPPPNRLWLRHVPGAKMPFMPQRSLDHNLAYCQGMILRLREFLPAWSVEQPMTVTGRR
jgi:radical SAM superfamily enzyme YgiQ (UPF0313 family)